MFLRHTLPPSSGWKNKPRGTEKGTHTCREGTKSVTGTEEQWAQKLREQLNLRNVST